MKKIKNKNNKTESQEMESLIRKQLKDIVKLLKEEGTLGNRLLFTHDDTPLLVATINAVLNDQEKIDALTKQMLDIDWDTGPVRF
jgi:hypothetical protein